MTIGSRRLKKSDLVLLLEIALLNLLKNLSSTDAQ